MKSRTVHGCQRGLVASRVISEWFLLRTGQVPLLMMLSKDNASGMPALLPELPEVYDSGFWSPLMESPEEVTWEGRR